MARAHTEVMQVVRESGLLRRTPWFYGLVAGAIALGFGGAITGFILLGDSWFQLLIAAALGILFTQVAFVAHEAAHRQVLSSGPANARLARVLANAVVEVLTLKSRQALEQTGHTRLAVGGGVAANRSLRASLARMTASLGAELFIPPMALCTDNAAMAALAVEKWRRGEFSSLDLEASPTLSLS